MKCKENMKTRRGAVTFAYSSSEATFLHLDVEPTQTVDVLGISCCFTFAVYQEE
jgi:hypothetical protein